MAEAEVHHDVNRWILLTVVMLGTFTAVLDTIAFHVALPYVMGAFGADIEQVKWTTIGFMIAAAVSMPLTHWLGQRLGYSTLYVSALLVFAAGAALSAASWSLDALIFARIVQGVGAGVVQPASIAILTRTFPPGMRGRAFGVWSAGVMLAPILAPVTAGVLIEEFSWRAIFSMSLLVSGAAVIVSIAVLRVARGDRPSPFDWKGYLTLSTFLMSGLVTLSVGQQEQWNSQTVQLGAAIALVSFVLFLLAEWGAEDPIVPLRLFRIPDFSLAMLLTLYKSLARVGAGFLLPIFLQRVQGRGSMQIGLLLTLGPVINTVLNPVVGYLTDRIGSRWLTVLGTLCVIYYLFDYSSIDGLSDVAFILYPQIFRGVGISLIDTPVMTAGVNSVFREDTGNASWMLNLSQRVGGAVAVTVISSLLHRQKMIEQELVGGSASTNRFPSLALAQRAIHSGFSPYAAKAASQAILVGELGKAATTLAYQRMYLLCGIGMLSSLLPAYLLTVFKMPARARAREGQVTVA